MSEGWDSFAEGPPNAVVSIANRDEFQDVVVSLSKKPSLNGDELVYTGIEIIEGDLPKSSGPGSIFDR